MSLPLDIHPFVFLCYQDYITDTFTFTQIWKSQEWRWLRQCASTSQVFLASDLPLVTRAFPFDWAGVISPSSSLLWSTSMGEGALLLGLALADSRTVLPPVELVSHGGEDRDGQLTFHRLNHHHHR